MSEEPAAKKAKTTPTVPALQARIAELEAALEDAAPRGTPAKSVPLLVGHWLIENQLNPILFGLHIQTKRQSTEIWCGYKWDYEICVEIA